MKYDAPRKILLEAVKHNRELLIDSLESGDRNHEGQKNWLEEYQSCLKASDLLAESESIERLGFVKGSDIKHPL